MKLLIVAILAMALASHAFAERPEHPHTTGNPNLDKESFHAKDPYAEKPDVPAKPKDTDRPDHCAQDCEELTQIRSPQKND